MELAAEFWDEDEDPPADLEEVINQYDLQFFRDHKPPFELRIINFDWTLLPRANPIDDYVEFYVWCAIQGGFESKEQFEQVFPFRGWMFEATQGSEADVLGVPIIRRFSVGVRRWLPDSVKQDVMQLEWDNPQHRIKDPDRFWDHLCDFYCNLSIREVRDFVHHQESWQIHKKPPGENFPVSAPTLVRFPHKRLQLDTTFLPNNRDPDHPNINAIITCVDCFSKKAWAWPIHANHSATSAKAWEMAGPVITAEAAAAASVATDPMYCARNFPGFKPWEKLQILTDAGSEFKGAFKEGLAKLPNLLQMAPAPYLSRRQGTVEAFNKVRFKCLSISNLFKTIKKFVFMEFSEQGQRGKGRWVDKVPEFLEAYNNTVHTATGFTPNEIHEEKSPEILVPRIKAAQQRLLKRAEKWIAHTRENTPKEMQELQVGDLVRRKIRLDESRKEALHAQEMKGAVGVTHHIHSYYPQWTNAVYKVLAIHPSHKSWTTTKAQIILMKQVVDEEGNVTFEPALTADGKMQARNEFITYLQKIPGVATHKVQDDLERQAAHKRREQPAIQALQEKGIAHPSANQVMLQRRAERPALRDRRTIRTPSRFSQ